MKKSIILSVSVNQPLADRVDSVVDSMLDTYGKKNRAHVLRTLLERGLEAVEHDRQDPTK